MTQVQTSSMAHSLRIPTDITSATFGRLLIRRLPAHGGHYVRTWAPLPGVPYGPHRRPGQNWYFVLDLKTRSALIQKGKIGNALRCSILPANRFVCWKTIPTQPLIGGFVHPETGFYCRSAAIPNDWDHAVFEYIGGTGAFAPPIGSLSDGSHLEAARDVARLINQALTKRAPNWWLYTLPMPSGVVRVGIASDRVGGRLRFDSAIGNAALHRASQLGVAIEYVQERPRPASNDAGMGAWEDDLGVPDDNLNWDLPSGYEGQAWTTHIPPDWSED